MVGLKGRDGEVNWELRLDLRLRLGLGFHQWMVMKMKI